MNGLEIRRLLAHGPKTVWECLRDTHLSSRELIAALDAAVAAGDVVHEQHVFRLTNQRAAVFNKKDLLEKHCAAAAERPQITEQFYQDCISSEAVVQRVQEMHDRCDLEGKRILILGDDDLMSLALAWTGLPKEIVVIEIDNRFVEFIAAQAKQHNLPISARVYNAADCLPENLHHAFDTFITEPPETEQALAVCLSRGAQSLKENGVLYVGMSTLFADKKKWHYVQQILNQMGFAVTAINKKDAFYPAQKNPDVYAGMQVAKNFSITDTPNTDFFSSSLIRAQAVEKPKPVITDAVQISKSFYFDGSAVHNEYSF